MKKILRFMLIASFAMFAFALTGFAQKLNSNNRTATLTGKISSCQRFTFDFSEGQRLRISLTSTDNKARFVLQNRAEVEAETTGCSL